jgi:hypothetical protein
VERRKLWATAGVLSIAAFSTTVGLGASFGLFGITEPESPVGHLDTRRSVTEVRVAPPPSTTAAPVLRAADD